MFVALSGALRAAELSAAARAPLERVPPSVSLVIGVLTFNHTTRAGVTPAPRRQAIRRISASADLRSPAVRVLFAIPADEPDVDTDEPDVLRLPIPRASRGVSGKFFLQNAFFRAAVRWLPQRVEWISRMDDDAMVSPEAIWQQLQFVRASGRDERYVAFGPHRNWYSWHPVSMQATCWDYSYRRGRMAWLDWAVLYPHNFSEALAAHGRRGPHECLRDGLEGPYPFASGPFVAYSRALAETLMGWSATRDAEEYVLSDRMRRHQLNVNSGATVAPSARSHPSNRILMEEVYYAYLLYKNLRGSNLLLIDEPMHEINGKDRIYALDDGKGRRGAKHSHIYHKLRHQSHFETLEAGAPEFLRHFRPRRLSCTPLSVNRSDERATWAKDHIWMRRVRDARKGAGGTLPPEPDWCCSAWTRCEYQYPAPPPLPSPPLGADD